MKARTAKTSAAAMMVALTLASTVAHAQGWVVGQEREVDEGVYARLVKPESGWRLWRFETKQGVTCKAVKSVKGQPHPVPVGVETVLFQGTPFIEIAFDQNWQVWSIEVGS